MRRRKITRNFILFLLTIPVFIFIYLPIIWLIISSISSRVELLSIPLRWFPAHPDLKNYMDILLPGAQASEVARTFKLTLRNSLVVATSVTAISLLVGSIAAYSLVRIHFPMAALLLIAILGVRMIPEISLVIPLYIFAARFGVLNTPIVLIITYLSFALPFAIWLMASFFETIPIELEDAARMDGCSRLQILFYILLPISAPGLISTTLFVFLLAWDEFFFALIFTSTVAAKTVPVAIAEFTGRYVVDITAMMTGGVLAAISAGLARLAFPEVHRQRDDRRSGEGLSSKTTHATYVGVDLGGTLVRVGILDGDTAQLLAFVQAPIEASLGAAKGIQRIIRTIETALDQSGCSSVAGIGIGATGPLDRQKGLIENPYTLPGWENVAISALSSGISRRR